MTTSGAYAFLPTIAEIISEAYERCGKDPATLTGSHIHSAIRSLNLALIELETEAGDMLYRLDRVSQSLTSGDRGFLLPVGTLAVIEAVLIRDEGLSTERRFIMSPISQTEWDSLEHSQSGLPTQYFIGYAQPGEAALIDDAVTAAAAPAWGPGTLISSYASDRLVFVFWQETDTTGDKIIYTRVRQTQDVDTNISLTPDVTRIWMETIFGGLAQRLATKWAPERKQMLQSDYAVALGAARSAARSREPVVFCGRGIGSPGRRRRM